MASGSLPQRAHSLHPRIRHLLAKAVRCGTQAPLRSSPPHPRDPQPRQALPPLVPLLPTLGPQRSAKELLYSAWCRRPAPRESAYGASLSW